MQVVRYVHGLGGRVAAVTSWPSMGIIMSWIWSLLMTHGTVPQTWHFPRSRQLTRDQVHGPHTYWVHA